MIKFRIAASIVAAVLSVSAQTPQYGYQVVHVYPHDPNAFTQGLEYRAGSVYESTGLKGRSSVRKVQLDTGKVLQQIDIDAQYFGEGITVVNQKIVELTWQSESGFVYDQSSFRRLQAFNYPGEGWGLANDGQNIYMSDGTAQIRIWDPLTLQEKRRITVHDQGKPVLNLNELEWVRGEIYANIWQKRAGARRAAGAGTPGGPGPDEPAPRGRPGDPGRLASGPGPPSAFSPRRPGSRPMP
jgi:glutaminyl-peptide cyclotransferase